MATHRSPPLLLYKVPSGHPKHLLQAHRLSNGIDLDIVYISRNNPIPDRAESLYVEWWLEIIHSNRDLSAVVLLDDEMVVSCQVGTFFFRLRLHVLDSKLPCLKTCVELVSMAASRFQRKLTLWREPS